MLVISRRAGESLLIGDGIEVRVLEISAARVKLGIVAPSEVTVLRDEVLLARQSNVEAARPPMDEQLAALAARLRESIGGPASEGHDKNP